MFFYIEKMIDVWKEHTKAKVISFLICPQTLKHIDFKVNIRLWRGQTNHIVYALKCCYKYYGPEVFDPGFISCMYISYKVQMYFTQHLPILRKLTFNAKYTNIKTNIVLLFKSNDVVCKM